jgi:hypothetical protein
MAKGQKEAAEKSNPGRGRPTKYSNELAIKICDCVAASTDGMRKMCRNNPDFPTSETLMQWRLKYPDFSARYAQAKLIQADLFAEEIVDLCDDVHEISDNIQKARLQIDSRKWLASKLLPKAYGDKTQTETILRISHEEALEALK